MKFSFRFFKKGFTLLEIMIAISLMAVGIVGIYALVPKVVSIGIDNADKFIASQLAREGFEIVRNIRDTNWLKTGSNWDDGLTGCSSGCEIDYNDIGFSSSSDRYLKISPDGFYNYENGDNSKFKRKITITLITQTGIDGLNVEVEITWPGKGSPLKVEEHLYNWK